MKIRWNGHSSFTLTAGDGTVIVTDPYEPGAFGGGIGYGAIPDSPDIVTISHDHADHGYTKGFASSFATIRKTGSAKGIDFSGISTYHDENLGAKRGKNTVLCFTLDDIRICHLGDLGHIPDADQYSAIGQVNVLLIPIGGLYTIDANQATEIVRQIKPQIAIPMHYKTAKCGFPISDVNAFTSGKPNVTHHSTDELELSVGTLPGEPKIIVLKHRL